MKNHFVYLYLFKLKQMNSLSISQLSEFSGVKQHTIRMWEQRYNALKPSRSEGNTRRYDGFQLRRLLNLVSLTESDYKISELGSLPDEKLYGLLKKVQQESSPIPTDYFVSQLIVAGMEYDEPAFDKLFSHCLLRYGLKDAYTKIIYPMLSRMGLLWTTNSLPPANEHFISNIVRQKLYVSIDALPPSTQDALPWVLFLPENEFHDIGLLMANYLLRISDKKTIYLGDNVPIQSVSQAVQETKAAHLLLFLTHNYFPQKIKSYVEEIKKTNPGKRIYISGNSKILNSIEAEKSIIKLGSVEDLEKQILLH